MTTARSALLGYSVSVLATIVALALTLLLWQAMLRNPFALFYVAVMFAAWYGGLGPGILAAGLAVAALDYFFVPSFFPMLPGWGDLIQAGTFILVAVLISTLNARRRRVVAQLNHSLEAEQEARSAAVEASRIKDEFLATVSHELRTPLNAMLGWSQLLRMGDLDRQTAREAIEAIERNAKTQAQIIEDLLDMSRIIRGRLKLNLRRVELAAVISAAVEAVQPMAGNKRLRIHCELDPVPRAVQGDPTRLEQIIWNLLSNAIKFTPEEGRVIVRLQCRDGEAAISVSDTGRGIRPEFLPHVFERFRQADASTTRSQGGLGLGLAIVRHLTELHGGRVHALSAGDGQGSTFTVTLPLMGAQAETSPSPSHWPAAGVELGDPQALEGVRVLIVDDEADARSLISTVLQRYGALVTSAGSTRDALEEIERCSPDVLVSDIGMPGEDGYALIDRVRQIEQERGGRIPAVALTAFARAEDRQRALQAGYEVHVPKPVEPAALAATVAALAARSRQAVAPLTPVGGV